MAQGNVSDSSTDPVEILLVEDNPGDVELTRRLLRDSNYNLNINVAEDGAVAMEYLHQKGEYANAPRPDLILLDLDMPKMNGYQVIEALKVHHILRHIPVMILTSTTAEGHMVFEQGIHPSRFCRKPLDLTQFDNLVSGLRSDSS